MKKEPIITNTEQASKEFVKLINSFGYKYDRYQVFMDFCEIAMITLRQPFERSDELEKRYFELIKQYSEDEVDRFAQLLTMVIHGLTFRHCDFLGKCFHELELHNKNAGQFFTPYNISSMMAQMTFNIDDLKAHIKEKGYITLNEPTCGSGGMVIAVDEHMKAHDINPAEHLYVVAQDIDFKVCCMCFIQLALLGVPACIIYGNTLMLEIRQAWYTPVFHLNGWGQRLAAHDQSLESKPTPEAQPEPEMQLIPEPEIETNYIQQAFNF